MSSYNSRLRNQRNGSSDSVHRNQQMIIADLQMRLAQVENEKNVLERAHDMYKRLCTDQASEVQKIREENSKYKDKLEKRAKRRTQKEVPFDAFADHFGMTDKLEEQIEIYKQRLEEKENEFEELNERKKEIEVENSKLLLRHSDLRKTALREFKFVRSQLADAKSEVDVLRLQSQTKRERMNMYHSIYLKRYKYYKQVNESEAEKHNRMRLEKEAEERRYSSEQNGLIRGDQWDERQYFRVFFGKDHAETQTERIKCRSVGAATTDENWKRLQNDFEKLQVKKAKEFYDKNMKSAKPDDLRKVFTEEKKVQTLDPLSPERRSLATQADIPVSSSPIRMKTVQDMMKKISEKYTMHIMRKNSDANFAALLTRKYQNETSINQNSNIPDASMKLSSPTEKGEDQNSGSKSSTTAEPENVETSPQIRNVSSSILKKAESEFKRVELRKRASSTESDSDSFSPNLRSPKKRRKLTVDSSPLRLTRQAKQNAKQFLGMRGKTEKDTVETLPSFDPVTFEFSEHLVRIDESQERLTPSRFEDENTNLTFGETRDESRELTEGALANEILIQLNSAEPQSSDKSESERESAESSIESCTESGELGSSETEEGELDDTIEERELHTSILEEGEIETSIEEPIPENVKNSARIHESPEKSEENNDSKKDEEENRDKAEATVVLSEEYNPIQQSSDKAQSGVLSVDSKTVSISDLPSETTCIPLECNSKIEDEEEQESIQPQIPADALLGLTLSSETSTSAENISTTSKTSSESQENSASQSSITSLDAACSLFGKNLSLIPEFQEELEIEEIQMDLNDSENSVTTEPALQIDDSSQKSEATISIEQIASNDGSRKRASTPGHDDTLSSVASIENHEISMDQSQDNLDNSGLSLSSNSYSTQEIPEQSASLSTSHSSEGSTLEETVIETTATEKSTVDQSTELSETTEAVSECTSPKPIVIDCRAATVFDYSIELTNDSCSVSSFSREKSKEKIEQSSSISEVTSKASESVKSPVSVSKNMTVQMTPDNSIELVKPTGSAKRKSTTPQKLDISELPSAKRKRAAENRRLRRSKRGSKNRKPSSETDDDQSAKEKKKRVSPRQARKEKQSQAKPNLENTPPNKIRAIKQLQLEPSSNSNSPLFVPKSSNIEKRRVPLTTLARLPCPTSEEKITSEDDGITYCRSDQLFQNTASRRVPSVRSTSEVSVAGPGGSEGFDPTTDDDAARSGFSPIREKIRQVGFQETMKDLGLDLSMNTSYTTSGSQTKSNKQNQTPTTPKTGSKEQYFRDLGLDLSVTREPLSTAATSAQVNCTEETAERLQARRNLNSENGFGTSKNQCDKPIASGRKIQSKDQEGISDAAEMILFLMEKSKPFTNAMLEPNTDLLRNLPTYLENVCASTEKLVPDLVPAFAPVISPPSPAGSSPPGYSSVDEDSLSEYPVQFQ